MPITKAVAAMGLSALGVAATATVMTVQLATASTATSSQQPIGGTSSAAGSTGSAAGSQGKGGPPASVPPAPQGHKIGVSWTLNKPLNLGAQDVVIQTSLANDENQDMVVTSLSGVVKSVDKAGCDPTWLTITPFNGTKTVFKTSVGQLDLPIVLDDRSDNQDACKDAHFQITVTAQARQA